ncbi:MAG: tRNA adenosine(34) deaminase TadA [Candidatus Berkiella sp.]
MQVLASQQSDLFWMQHALSLASKARCEDEVPVGAVIVRDNEILGEGYNQPIFKHDPTAHAEIQAIRDAARHDKNYRLTNTTLYVTLEPCAMCAGAIIQARISKVVFGAFDPRSGAAGSVFNVLNEPALNHRCEVIAGVAQEACAEILKSFFKAKR